jgi:phosphotransferase system enzyme I (PtsI)
MLEADELEPQLGQFDYAVERSKQELEKISAVAEQKAGAQGSAIFEAQRMMLADTIVLDAIRSRIRTEKKSAAFVVDSEYSHHQHFLATSENPLLRERADDVEDIKQRLLRHLLEKQKWISKLDHPAIVVAEFLTPGDTILFSRQELMGFAVDTGGATSHIAILARSIGVPAIVGLHGAAAHVETNDIIIVDGDRGELFIAPDDDTLARYKELVIEQEAKKKIIAAKAKESEFPAKTIDDRKIIVNMNMELISDAAIEEAEQLSKIKGKTVRGLGLLRTEHFLSAYDEMPSEEDQTKIYCDLAKRFHPAPITIRTFDIGGDKMIGGGFREKNPFLGWRGIRISLDQPETHVEQLRAILRASAGHNVKLLLPMVGNVDQLNKALFYLEEAKQSLRRSGEAFDENIPVGVMIEVPAAALHAPAFASRCDFLSIGTNDLTQYTLAVDRGNEFVAHLFDELHPAVLRLISMTVRAAHARKRPVSLCGEMAGKPIALPFIIGMGIDEISVAPNRVRNISGLIRKIKFSEARGLVKKVLNDAQTVSELKQSLFKFLHKRNLVEDFLTPMEIEMIEGYSKVQ